MNINIEFLADRPLSYSSIKEFAKSPKHYINYLTAPREPSKEMNFGSLVHCLVLYPSKFNMFFSVAPNVDRRTKDGKAAWDEFVSKSDGKTVVTEQELHEAKQITDNVVSDSKIKDAVSSCRSFEEEFKTMVNNLPFRGFVDGLSNDFILEVKTISDGSHQNVIKDFYNRKYHIQAALYSKTFDRPLKYLIIENRAPYNYVLADASSDYIERGWSELLELTDKFQVCMSLDAFGSGYEFMMDSEFVVGLPSWIK